MEKASKGIQYFHYYFFRFSGIVGVQIREMRVPAVVESGKQPHVILDCDYYLSENEGKQVNLYWIYLNVDLSMTIINCFVGGC